MNSNVANSSTIMDTATVSSPANGSSTASSSATVNTSADLSITKNGPAGVMAGQNIVYTIVATDNGPSDATSVMVSDTTPAGTTFVSNSGACTTAFPCNIGTLTSGQSSTITDTYTATAGDANGTIISNTATVSSAVTDPTPGNNTSPATSTTVSNTADLSITKNGPATVTAGQNIVYTIVATNNGPNSATSVMVSDPTPAGATFVSNSGACTTPFPCNIGTLTNGQSGTITATYTANAGDANGSIVSNTATVSSAVTDPTPGNNTSLTTSTTVNTSADLSITKVPPPTVTYLTNASYTITVNNAGPSNSQNVVVTDAIPGNTLFVSANPSQGSCSGTGTVTCSLGTINAGSSATIVLMLKLNSGNSVTNTASVAAGTADPNLANNTSTTAAIPVTPLPSSLILILAGLGVLVLYRARRRLTRTI